MSEKPPASLSLDFDNLWSYMKIHGDAGWESHPSYMDVLVPIVLERLKRHGLTITCFLVGQDAAIEANRGPLAELARAGHGIGNHSFSHEPWFHEYDRERVEQEIRSAEEHIEQATGKRPRGFRGPGFSLSRDVIDVLLERGYDYDASTFPTFLGPLARAYYFWNARGLSAEEKQKRKKLYGTAAEGLRPLKPYLWDGGLLEIPVTTMPVFRVPFHLSYLIYLAGYSRVAFRLYFRLALALCRARGIQPSFLLHPLDFLGGDRVRELAFFPGMSMDTEKKLALFDEAMGILGSFFRPLPIEEHAKALRRSGYLTTRSM